MRVWLIKTDSKSVQQSAQVKFLGLHLDSHLTWSNQVDIILKKLSTTCFVLWQLRGYVTTDILITYYAYVYSTLNYGILCWGNCTRVSEVLILQKRILRIMTFKSPRYSCRDLFKQFNLLTVTSIYILNCVCYVRSHPDKFSRTRDANSPYNFRLNLNMVIPRHTMSASANGPLIMAVKLFNKLPIPLKLLPTFNMFKSSVRNMLQKHSFYSIEEFLNCVNL